MLLNGIAMFALAAIAVPIAVHLQRRKRAKLVDWAAMRFLSRSLASRRRGFTLEQLLLLLCRCLLIAVFVLAMARPLLTSATDIRWAVGLALGFLGLVALTATVVVRTSIARKLIAFAITSVLLSGAAAAAFLGTEALLNTLDQPRDVAIVIDASSSMNVEVDGESNFGRALEEARLLVDELPGGSTVSVTVAGPVIDRPASSATDLSKIADQIGELASIGGATSLSLATERARKSIERGPNTRKQVVVFSDNQLQGWNKLANNTVAAGDNAEAQTTKDNTANDDVPPSDSADPSETAVTAESEDEQSPPQLYARAFPLPPEPRDLAVVGIEVAGRLLGTGRPVEISVELYNGGAVGVSDGKLELLVDDVLVKAESPIQLERQSGAKVQFTHLFESAGWHTLSARLTSGDSLADDDLFQHVVHVAEDLPVLVVNGNPAGDRLDRPATFAQLALDPASLGLGTEQHAGRRSGLARVEVLDAAELQGLESFADYQVVLLCDVPRLSTTVAERLAIFVEHGGGLFVLPGERAEPDFYNAWVTPETEAPLLPARLSQRQLGLTDALSIDLDSASHPTLNRVLETGEHDLTEFRATAYWQQHDWPQSQPVVGIRLTNGDPLLVEHTVGHGRVMTLAVSLNSLENNLISRVSFPVLMHLWVHHLASAGQLELSLQPARDLVLQLKETDLPGIEPGTLMLELPDGTCRDAIVRAKEDAFLIEMGTVAASGAYRLFVGDNPASAAASLPFTINTDADEYDLTPASLEKLHELGELLHIAWIDDVDQLQSFARGAPEGVELWQHFTLAAFAMLLIEVGVSRWIAARRNVPANEPTPQNSTERPAALQPQKDTAHTRSLDQATGWLPGARQPATVSSESFSAAGREVVS